MKCSSKFLCHHHPLVLVVFWCLTLPYNVLCQVLVIPPSRRLIYSGATTDFECVPVTQLTIQSITWQINGSQFENLTYDNIQQAFLRPDGSRELRGGSLTITNTPVVYNSTTVQCVVEYTTGSRETSDTTSLLIQGTLHAVELMVFVSGNSEVFSNWTAPFTLLGASDITYCVTIDSTKRMTLLSECGTNTTQFTFFTPLNFACEELSFSVTPVNVVGNGTTSTIMLTDHSSVPETSPELEDVALVSSEVLLLMSAPVCAAELTLVDYETEETITLEDTDLNITETIITFSTQQLRDDSCYSVTIIASNIAGRADSRTSICIGDGVLSTLSSSSPSGSDQQALTIGLIGGLAILVLLAIIQSVIIVILCCKKRQKAPVQLGPQNLQLYEEVRDPEPTASSTVSIGKTSSMELAVPVPQYEDITLPEDTIKSGDPYQITLCPAYVASK